MSRVEALLRERDGYVRRNLPNRVAAVDVELARLGHHIEPADTATVTEAVVKRGPGRPRKQSTAG